MTKKKELEIAEKNTNTSPTSTQKKTGNYAKGQIEIKGLLISIENPKNSIREGVGADGKSWRSKMNHTYGYFNNTLGKDGDPIDVFIGGEIDKDFDVFVIDQVDESKNFDEHKVMLGFKDEKSASKAYLSNYEKGWQGLGSITRMNVEIFKSWLYDRESTVVPATEYKNKYNYKNQMSDEKITIIELKGEVVEGNTLQDLKKQAGDPDFFDTLVLEIASQGGSVLEGLQIMLWLDWLARQGKQVMTVVTANSYSIASLIMLVAHVKLISRYGEVMVHNPMVPELKHVNANELEKYLKDLRGLESAMHNLYKMLTGLKEDEIKALMDKETYLSPQEAVKMGFADMVIDMEKRPYEMGEKQKTEINMSNLLNQIRSSIAKVNGAKFVNQVYYPTDGQQPIEIFQNDPSTYATGDRTTFESGQVQLADGSVLTIENFIITDIQRGQQPPMEQPPMEQPPVEQPMEQPPVQEPPVEQPPIEEDPNRPMAQEGPKKEEMVSKAQFEQLFQMVEGLKSSVESVVAQAQERDKEYKNQLAEAKQFEKLTAEALDTIATNQASNFKPEAVRVEQYQVNNGSIFNKMRQKAGLK